MRCLLLLLYVITSHAQRSDFNLIDFNLADSIAAEYKVKGITNLPLLSQHLTGKLNTDVEKFRAIYTWVCSNIANDYYLSYKNNRRRKKYTSNTKSLQNWNTSFSIKMFSKLKRKHRTVCTGYAYLVKALANFSGIDCEIVNGYGKNSQTNPKDLNTPNHSWNAVKLNDKWYLCDPTWSSVKGLGLSKEKAKSRIDAYFLSDPYLFSLNHSPQNPGWLLTDDGAVNSNIFSETPVLYSSAFNVFTTKIEPNTLHNQVNQNEIIQFKFTLQKQLSPELIKLLIIKRDDNYFISPQNLNVTNLKLSFKHQFKGSGDYDVHVFIGDEVAISYSFKVLPKVTYAILH